MRALIQRVSHAQVTVDGRGGRPDRSRLCRSAGRHPADSRAEADCWRPRSLAARLRRRGRQDEPRAGRCGGGAAGGLLHSRSMATRAGATASFTRGAARSAPSRWSITSWSNCATRASPWRPAFWAHMDVEIHNDGPVTMLLEREGVEEQGSRGERGAGAIGDGENQTDSKL